ncbi:hypothetical protein CsSME_00032504 [Camellia sinensis var. sinensis]
MSGFKSLISSHHSLSTDSIYELNGSSLRILICGSSLSHSISLQGWISPLPPHLSSILRFPGDSAERFQSELRNIKGQVLTSGSSSKQPVRKQFLDSASFSDSESTEASTSISMDELCAVDSASVPSTSRATEVDIKGVVLLSVSLSREVVPGFARMLLHTSLGKKYLVRPLQRTEITQSG